MRAINHATTGAIIGLSVIAPIAIPLAFVSHYALDAIPHHDDNTLSHNKFTALLLGDLSLCVLLAAIIFFIHPPYWWLAILCAFIATSPDLMWFRQYWDRRSGKKSKSIERRCGIVRLHAKVQWFQKPIGLVVEIAWLLITGLCLYFLLRS